MLPENAEPAAFGCGKYVTVLTANYIAEVTVYPIYGLADKRYVGGVRSRRLDDVQ